MKSPVAHIILILLCVVSRLLTAINYIEDPESLRFALSLYEYDLFSLQPNFPGYSVFCFLAKFFNLLLRNNTLAFSAVGALALYLTILYSLKILKVPLLSLEGGLVAFFLFFNPMIWLMSNRFTPDLLGTAILMLAFYYLIIEQKDSRYHLAGWLFTGLLAGVRISYLPFLVIPCIYAFAKRGNKFFSILSLLAGAFLVVIPVILSTSFSDLVEIVSGQNFGTYSEYGGESYSRVSIVHFVQNIWADGLGGFWADRSLITLFNSFGILVCLLMGMVVLLSFEHDRKKVIILCASFFLYGIWILLFQNIVDSNRYFLPFIPFLVMAISYGVIYFLVNFNYIGVKLVVVFFLVNNIFLSVYLALQHQNPTAIAQVKELLDSKEEKELHVVSIPLINLYLEQQGVKAKFYSAETDQEKISKINSGKIITVGSFPGLIKRPKQYYSIYRHNPYVNRIWPEIEVYQY